MASMVLEDYGTGSAPVYFKAGYVRQGDGRPSGVALHRAGAGPGGRAALAPGCDRFTVREAEWVGSWSEF
jgi:hypothetical protein